MKQINDFKTLACTVIMMSNIICASNIYAKEIHGYVVSPETTPIYKASVSFYALPDTTFKGLTTSDKTGRFVLTIEDNNLGNLIRIESLGYTPFVSDNFASGDTIILQPNSANLDEVVVSAKRTPLVRKAGRMIYDPSELQGEAYNAIDVLKKMPVVSFENNVASIFGYGAADIYINGKDPKMSNEAVIQYLQQTSLQNIKKVEIVTTQGSAQASYKQKGIVNFIIDDPRNGFLSSMSVDATYNNGKISPSYSGWLGYSKGKFHISFAPYYSFTNTLTHEYNYFDYKSYDKTVTLDTKTGKHGNSVSGSFNLDYRFNQKFWLGAYLSLYGSSITSQVNTASTEVNNQTEITEDLSIIKTRYPFSGPLIKTGVYGEWNLNKYSSLNVSADYGQSHSNTYSYNDLSGEEFSQAYKSQNYVGEGNVKYAYSNEKVGTIKAGYMVDATKMDYSYDGADNAISEVTNAVYASYSKDISAVSFSAGIRMENYNRHTTWGDSANKYTRLDWFPSFSFNWNIGKASQSISLDYTRRSWRAPFSFYNPTRYYESEYSYSCGNPELAPSSYHKINLNYSLLNCITLSASYSISNDSYLQYKMNDGLYTISSITNGGKDESYKFGINFSKKLFPFLRIKCYFDLYDTNKKATLYNKDLTIKSWSWASAVNLFFSISQKHGIDASVRNFLVGPEKTLDGRIPLREHVSCGISKRFGDWGDISLYCSDLVYTHHRKHYNDPAYSYLEKTLSSARSISISFNVYFGKFTINTPRSMYNRELESKYAK